MISDGVCVCVCVCVCVWELMCVGVQWSACYKGNWLHIVYMYAILVLFSLWWQFFTFHTDTGGASKSKSSGATAGNSQSSGGATQKSIGKSMNVWYVMGYYGFTVGWPQNKMAAPCSSVFMAIPVLPLIFWLPIYVTLTKNAHGLVFLIHSISHAQMWALTM